MKKLLLLFMFVLANLTISAQQLIYTPYYLAYGNQKNGKVTWEKYGTINSSSVIVSNRKIEINLWTTTLVYHNYNKAQKGRNKSGRPYLYYKGLKMDDGYTANLRLDFYENDWVVISVYHPSKPTYPNSFKLKCKLLAEM